MEVLYLEPKRPNLEFCDFEVNLHLFRYNLTSYSILLRKHEILGIKDAKQQF